MPRRPTLDSTRSTIRPQLSEPKRSFGTALNPNTSSAAAAASVAISPVRRCGDERNTNSTATPTRAEIAAKLAARNAVYSSIENRPKFGHTVVFANKRPRECRSRDLSLDNANANSAATPARTSPQAVSPQSTRVVARIQLSPTARQATSPQRTTTTVTVRSPLRNSAPPPPRTIAVLQPPITDMDVVDSIATLWQHQHALLFTATTHEDSSPSPTRACATKRHLPFSYARYLQEYFPNNSGSQPKLEKLARQITDLQRLKDTLEQHARAGKKTIQLSWRRQEPADLQDMISRLTELFDKLTEELDSSKSSLQHNLRNMSRNTRPDQVPHIMQNIHPAHMLAICTILDEDAALTQDSATLQFSWKIKELAAIKYATFNSPWCDSDQAADLYHQLAQQMEQAGNYTQAAECYKKVHDIFWGEYYHYGRRAIEISTMLSNAKRCEALSLRVPPNTPEQKVHLLIESATAAAKALELHKQSRPETFPDEDSRLAYEATSRRLGTQTSSAYESVAISAEILATNNLEMRYLAFLYYDILIKTSQQPPVHHLSRLEALSTSITLPGLIQFTKTANNNLGQLKLAAKLFSMKYNAHKNAAEAWQRTHFLHIRNAQQAKQQLAQSTRTQRADKAFEEAEHLYKAAQAIENAGDELVSHAKTSSTNNPEAKSTAMANALAAYDKAISTLRSIDNTYHVSQHGVQESIHRVQRKTDAHAQ